MKTILAAVVAAVLVASPGFARAEESTCSNPQWIKAFVLDPAAGCPGAWNQISAHSHVVGAPDVTACSRGRVWETYQSSAVLVEGYTYSKVRGWISGYAMGSPDSFRPEGKRGEMNIDDPYMDGVSIAMWTPQGREHVASYVAGLSYNARDFSYYVNGNCICHGGVDGAPTWLEGKPNVFCDAGIRGGSTCKDKDGKVVICTSADDCAAKGCNLFFSNGMWYPTGEHGLMWKDSKEFLCSGDVKATDADFADAPLYGGFHHDVGKFTSHPIESRIMAGQTSSQKNQTAEDLGLDGEKGDYELLDGNEDVAVVGMEIEVYGCKMDSPPVCGDGKIEYPEQCDLGAGENTEGSKCSRACTTWNPQECKYFGTCPPVIPEEPSGETFPGKKEVGSNQLPKWLPIADVVYKDYLQPGVECHGNMKKFRLRKGDVFENFCGPPLSAKFVSNEPSKFFVNTQIGTAYAAVRGHMSTVSKGQMDAFLNASMPYDFSAVACYKPGMCSSELPGRMDTHEYRESVTRGIDGRYVDGVSFTVGEPGNRTHIYTLAAGTARGIPAKAPVSSTLSQASSAADWYGACFKQLDGSAPVQCYSGNCRCHDPERKAWTGLNEQAGDWGLPSFVGGDYQCDGGITEDVGYLYSNDWKTSPMFVSTETCVAGQSKDAKWWEANAEKVKLANKKSWGPGWWRKDLDAMYADPVEVRVMAGSDSFYENLGILDFHLEVCVCKEFSGWPGACKGLAQDACESKSQDSCIWDSSEDKCEKSMGVGECIAFCDGTYVHDSIERNYLESWAKTPGTALGICGLLLCAVCAVWTMINLDTKVVRYGQPIFLFTIILGCVFSLLGLFVMQSDANGSEVQIDESGVESWPALDNACRLFPFTYVIGFGLSYGALFAKVWRTHKIFLVNAKKLVASRVPPSTAAFIILVFVFVSVGIVLAWTLSDPLTWTRVVDGTQYVHGKEITIGTRDSCQSQNATPFLVLLGMFQFSVYAYGCVLCYKTRSVSSYFAECKWISISIVNNIQVFLFAVTVLYMVSDSPSAFYIVKCFVLFINDVGVLALIFFPKMYAKFSGADVSYTSSQISKTLGKGGTVLSAVSDANAARNDDKPGHDELSD